MSAYWSRRTEGGKPRFRFRFLLLDLLLKSKYKVQRVACVLTGAAALWGATCPGKPRAARTWEEEESRTKEKYSLSVMQCDRKVEEKFIQFVAKECEEVTH